jgi:hypothetical protein
MQRRRKSDVLLTSSQERHVLVVRRKSDVIGQYGEKNLKFPLFFDSMANFVHNIANRMSKFFQYVLVPLLGSGSSVKTLNFLGI